MIRVALVPRCDYDKPGPRGVIYVSEDGAETVKHAQETPTPNGLRREVQTLLNRYVGQDVELAIYGYERDESRKGVAVLALLLPGVPIHETGLRQPPQRGKRNWDPFARNFRGKVLRAFVPDWYEPEEPASLLRAIDLDSYALPDTE